MTSCCSGDGSIILPTLLSRHLAHMCDSIKDVGRNLTGGSLPNKIGQALSKAALLYIFLGRWALEHSTEQGARFGCIVRGCIDDGLKALSNLRVKLSQSTQHGCAIDWVQSQVVFQCFNAMENTDISVL
ncbi:hypothetical protein D3C81_1921080 [compost metagenome]